MNERWPLGELARESVRNLCASRRVGLLLMTVVAVSVGAGTFLDANEARQARTQLAQQITDGGWVTVARGGRGIEASACRRLAHQHGVLAAGGVEKPRSVALSSAPGTLFEAYGATPELIDTLLDRPRPVADVGVVAVGTALARELGLVEGSHIVFDPQAHYTVTILPESVRAQRFSRALIVPGLPRDVDECWVEWMPGTEDARGLTESLLAVDAPLTVSATLTSGAYTRDPRAQYAGRWTRWWSVAVGGLGALVVVGGLRTRTRPMALYVAVGTARSELAVLYGLEVLVLALLGTVIGVVWGLAAVAAGGELTTFDVGSAMRAAACVPAAIALLTVLAVSARRFDAATELKAE